MLYTQLEFGGVDLLFFKPRILVLLENSGFGPGRFGIAEPSVPRIIYRTFLR
jgi:hypothetical protein